MESGNQNEQTQEPLPRRWWRRVREGPQGAEQSRNGERPQTGTIVCEGELVRLRKQTVANRAAYQRWYADPEIARLLRHDLQPMSYMQSLVSFDTMIMPSSALGYTCAIHDKATDELIGTTGLTEVDQRVSKSCYYRILIGESRYWNRGYGTEATRLMMRLAFERHGLEHVNLEVFEYNQRALTAYERVGFIRVGEHSEWPELGGEELRVIEMRLSKVRFLQCEEQVRDRTATAGHPE
jgi:RimJ/RimL family protein N-acetyltransferase